MAPIPRSQPTSPALSRHMAIVGGQGALGIPGEQMHEFLSILLLQDFFPVRSANQERQGPATVPRGVSTLRLRHLKEPAPGQVQLRDFWSTSNVFQLLWAEAAHSHGKNVDLRGWDH